jgi:DNA-binding NarL/FixJ family response regulator
VKVRVLIVDDHPGFRMWARTVLESAGYRVVGEAADGASALRVAEELRPDVVLLDIVLPDLSGFDLADRLTTSGFEPAVVLVSSRDAADYGGRIAASPAVGFIPKAELSGSALRALVDGTS